MNANAPFAPRPMTTVFVSNAAFTIGMDCGAVCIRCETCQAVSYNGHDVEQKFCGRCDKFHDRSEASVPPFLLSDVPVNPRGEPFPREGLVNAMKVADQLVAKDIEGGVLVPGTALTVLHVVRDQLRHYDAELGERLTPQLTEAVCRSREVTR